MVVFYRMVGSINMSIKVGDHVRKGDDIGYFAFGKSFDLLSSSIWHHQNNMYLD
jgi:phosphatidylserine decarboxylase